VKTFLLTVLALVGLAVAGLTVALVVVENPIAQPSSVPAACHCAAEDNCGCADGKPCVCKTADDVAKALDLAADQPEAADAIMHEASKSDRLTAAVVKRLKDKALACCPNADKPVSYSGLCGCGAGPGAQCGCLDGKPCRCGDPDCKGKGRAPR
jgi:hypothetical protein